MSDCGGPDARVLAAAGRLIEDALATASHRPVVIGLCGAQGSGKSTLARAIVRDCEERAIPAAALSIDDLYLTRAERAVLARTVHPLLATRGPPGTHDTVLGEAVFEALERGGPARLPLFDKASDDRAPQADWPAAPHSCRVLVFEGWCVGARPQPQAALARPVNALEVEEDPEGIWRGYVNEAQAGAYQRLFARIDRLVMLAAPDFDVVPGWRLQQEAELRERVGERAGPDASGIMDYAQVARFIQHYERLTRHMLAEMPGRADLLVRLDARRRPEHIRFGPAA